MSRKVAVGLALPPAEMGRAVVWMTYEGEPIIMTQGYIKPFARGTYWYLLGLGLSGTCTDSSRIIAYSL